MPVDRPTFSESWYRVAQLRPRLRTTVRIQRQHFRGQLWHVVRDPSSNQFFRLPGTAYRFVGMLDGHRTVADVWKTCNEQAGDAAPTQGEAIQLLGQLYTANLLQAELAPDAESLFHRYRKRVTREVQGHLMNLLFIRLPLLDPDRFLDRWVGIFGRLFSWFGLAIWFVVVGAGLFSLAGHLSQFATQALGQDASSGVLSADNLPLLYLGFILIKVFHEFGHAFACKKFGRQSGTGGEVHIMGIMLLVFMPIPYVDASSSWLLRSKWQRAVIGAAGMLVELPLAAIACIVWTNTTAGHPVNAIAYNVMFVAGVSTLLFNGNPLLRYDGYYILSDLLEIPNLAQRGKDYLYYLVKRYVWSVRLAHSPAHTQGEKVWLLAYALSSGVYRVFISVAILLFVADKLFVLGAILATAAVVGWLLVPLGRFLHYLATSGELARVRSRAVLTTVVTMAAIVVGIGIIPAPDRCYVEGVVEPVDLAIVHAASDGFVEQYTPSGQTVDPNGAPLLKAFNMDLLAQRDKLLADREALLAKRREALAKSENYVVQAYDAHLAKVQADLARTQRQLDDLDLKAPLSGTWVSPNVERFQGAYLRRGDKVGLVANLDQMIVRAVAGQDVGELIINSARPQVEIRVKGRPPEWKARELTGTIRQILPAGQDQLPSASLGYAVGGTIQTAPHDEKGMKTVERFFEIRITPEPPTPDGAIRLLSGQRVMVRIEMPPKSLASQWRRTILQLVQKRFHI